MFKHIKQQLWLFIVCFMLSAISVCTPAHAEIQAGTVPFEYGTDTISNLSGASMSGLKSMFTFNGDKAFPIINDEKGDIYLFYKNAGFYTDENFKSIPMDIRIYVWRYQEGTPEKEDDRVYPFIYLTEDGIAHIASNNQEGNYGNAVGNLFHSKTSRSNGGIQTEYHFYDSTTGEEINFQGTIVFSDLDGASGVSGYVNEGIAITGGEYEPVTWSDTKIVQSERDGLLWHQGTMMTEDILSAGLTSDTQKLLVKFKSTPQNPFSAVHRIRTYQDGRAAAYDQTINNSTVTISYMIAKKDLPSLSTDKGMTELIQGGGGEQSRVLNYGTDTSGSTAQGILNIQPEAVDGYTFDGWYSSSGFEPETKWTGTGSMTKSIILWGRYVKKQHTFTVRFYEVKEDGTLTENAISSPQSKTFLFGSRIASKGPVISHAAHEVKDSEGNKTGETHNAEGHEWDLGFLTVDGGVPESAVQGETVVHFAEGNTVDKDVNVNYYYYDKSTSVPDFEKTLKENGSETESYMAFHYGKDDKIPFELSAVMPESIGADGAYQLVFHDILPDGMSYDEGSLHTYRDGEEIPIENSHAVFDGNSLTVEIADAKSSPWNAAHGTEISVQYKASINKNAVFENTNEAYLSYSETPGSSQTAQTETAKASVYAFGIQFEKTDEAGNPLEGAEFTVYKKGEDGVYTELEAAGREQSVFSFTGLAAGDYMLAETYTPDGYNTAENLFFTITAEPSVKNGNTEILAEMLCNENPAEGWQLSDDGVFISKIRNTSGFTLPATGGLGTYGFTAAGVFIFLCSAFILIWKKQNSQ